MTQLLFIVVGCVSALLAHPARRSLSLRIERIPECHCGGCIEDAILGGCSPAGSYCGCPSYGGKEQHGLVKLEVLSVHF